MANRKSAYGGPAEEKEIVLSFDSRALFALVLVLGFFTAIGAGFFVAKQQAGDTATAAQPGAANAPAAQSNPAGQQPNTQIDEASAKATAQALGLPDSVQIAPQINQVQDEAAPSSADDPFADVRARITPADPVQETMLNDPRSVPFEVPEERGVDASQWSHDVLANFPDANVNNEQYSPLRYEDVQDEMPLSGPRLAIAELNKQFTYDFGVVPMREPALHQFTAVNVGDEDLVISRVYSGCGCTATQIGGDPIKSNGFLEEPLTLKPGESVEFGVEFDPRAEGKSGSQAKYIQIFTNDPTKMRFEDDDPLSHETRFRIVVEPRSQGVDTTGDSATDGAADETGEDTTDAADDGADDTSGDASEDGAGSHSSDM